MGAPLIFSEKRQSRLVAARNQRYADSFTNRTLLENQLKTAIEAEMTDIRNVHVPNIGDYKNIPVISILVGPGDVVDLDDSLITLESDKATMEIPSPMAGVVQSIAIRPGDMVSEGTLVLSLSTSVARVQGGTLPNGVDVREENIAESPQNVADGPTPQITIESHDISSMPPSRGVSMVSSLVRAGPSVRKFARELGVDLGKVNGSGPRNRQLREDVARYVKNAIEAPSHPTALPHHSIGLDLLPWPKVDFGKFGPISTQQLSRIKKISGANLHRNWVRIPHVTNHDEADITELEAFRLLLNKENANRGVKVSMLAFLIKVCAAALKQFPTFNAALDGENLVTKQYFNIGFAANTPAGLVVPVVRDVDQMSVVDIAQEVADLSKLARDGKLKPEQMQGGCITISSLGGIGGTAFTPIINAPEVAILGASKAQMKPVWDGTAFAPRLILPLSLSWDHRVIDGAEAARFNTYLSQLLSDMRRIVL